MRIHCDGCTREIAKETAIAVRIEDEVYYFCSPECQARRRVAEPVLLEEEEDRPPEEAGGD